MARTTIRTEDITAGEVTTAKMATDPTNASNLSSGSVPTAQLGNVDTSGITANQDDIALLGFKVASNGSLAKYNLVDQTIDAFEDDSGIDSSASTNDVRTAGYYSGGSGTTSTDKTFAYTGANESWTVPGSTTTITVKSWGAGGGGGGHTACGGGGGGGYSTSVFAVTGGPTLIGVLGGGGKYGSKAPDLAGGGAGAFGGGGGAYNDEGTYSDANGGGGGGYSGLFVGSVSQANAIIISGGAGGGGYNTCNGGYGGGTSGGDGEDGLNSNGRGLAGTDSAGGAAGSLGDSVATAGSALQGGTGSKTSQPYYGATGGGGWYGGGGAGVTGAQGSSGSGGGSGYVRSSSFPTGVTSSSSTTMTNGSIGSGTTGGDEGNSGDSDSSGKGGNQSRTGENGALTISYSYSPVSDMTLVSNATTAEDGAPTKGNLVVTYTNGVGTATVGTDIKFYISRDGTNYTGPITMTSQGTTGGHTILTANDVSITSTSGTSMRWKITTHNQDATKETRVQAVSLGWS